MISGQGIIAECTECRETKAIAVIQFKFLPHVVNPIAFRLCAECVEKLNRIAAPAPKCSYCATEPAENMDGGCVKCGVVQCPVCGGSDIDVAALDGRIGKACSCGNCGATWYTWFALEQIVEVEKED